MNIPNESEVDENEHNTNGPFRVRNVSEINTEYIPKKRKLPNWLNSSPGPEQEEVSCLNKRQCTEDLVSCSSTNSTNNLHKEEEDATNKTLDESNDVLKYTGKTNGDKSIEKLEIPCDRVTSLLNNNIVTNSDTNPTGRIESSIQEDENSSALTNMDQKPTLVLPLPIKVEIEEIKEPISSTASGTTLNIIPSIKQNIKEEPSSTTRESCKYGIRCYRRNPQHRSEQAHPGDTDYRRPNFPPPPKGTPDCPFGDLCYRRNPSHFRDFSHPPSTDFKKNWQSHQKRLRDRKTKVKKSDDNYEDDLDDNEYDLNDDFIDDGSDDEFVPTDDDDSDEDFE